MKKRIAILASDYCLYSGVASPMDMFIQAGVSWNGFLGKDPSPYFDVMVVTLDGRPVTTYNDMKIEPHCSISDIGIPDLIFLPSQGFHYDSIDNAHAQKVAWLQDCFGQGSDLASACTGSFMLAHTGLLNDKMATTHWGAARAFRHAFPQVNLRTDLLVTDEGRLFCAGGVTADLNLSLYLIKKYCGHEIAVQCSKCTLVDIDRLSQSPFATFVPEKNHGDKVILDIQNWIDKNYREDISVELLAEKAFLSPRQLNRRFRQATGESILSYVQNLKIEVVKALLEQTRRKFSDISESVGYSNESHLRRLFKRQTGLTPSDYRNKFSY